MGEGKVVKVAGKEFLSVKTSKGEKLLVGQYVNVNGKEVFVPGQTMTVNGVDKFVAGVVVNENGVSTLVPGQVVDLGNNQKQFVSGQFVETMKGLEFLPSTVGSGSVGGGAQGALATSLGAPLSAQTSQNVELQQVVNKMNPTQLQKTKVDTVLKEKAKDLPESMEIQEIVQNMGEGKVVKVAGKEFLSVKTSKGEKLLVGQYVNVNGKEVFVPGQTMTVNGVDKFVAGVVVNENGVSTLVPGQVVDLGNNQKQFVSGQFVETMKGLEFLPSTVGSGSVGGGAQGALATSLGAPLSAQTSQNVELQQVVNKMNPTQLQKTKVDTVLKEKAKDLPESMEIQEIVQNMGEGKVVKVAGKEFLSVKTSKGEKLLVGQYVNVNGKEVFVPGQTMTVNGVDKFVAGVVVNENGVSTLVPGQVVDLGNNQKQFVSGQFVETMKGLEFLPSTVGSGSVGGGAQGALATSLGAPLSAQTSQNVELQQVVNKMNPTQLQKTKVDTVLKEKAKDLPESMEIQEIVQNMGEGKVVKVAGKEFLSVKTSKGEKLLVGQYVNVNGKEVFVPGQTMTVNGVDKFVAGVVVNENGVSTLVPGQVVDLGNNQKQFVSGQFVETMKGLEFLPSTVGSGSVGGGAQGALATSLGAPLSAQTSQNVELQQVVNKMNPTQLQKTKVDTVLKEKAKDLPESMEIQEIVQNMGEGKVVKVAGKEFLSVKTSKGEKLLVGQYVNVNGKEVFVPGQTMTVNGVDKFVAGVVVNENGVSTLVPGQVVDLGNNQKQFCAGEFVETLDGLTFMSSSISSSLRSDKNRSPLIKDAQDGHYEFNPAVVDYIEKLNSLQLQNSSVSQSDSKIVKSLPLFTDIDKVLQEMENGTIVNVCGKDVLCVKSDLGENYLVGQHVKLDGKSLFVPGQTLLVSGVESFIPGLLTNENGLAKLIPGQIITENNNKQFVIGQFIKSDNRIDFIETLKTENGIEFVRHHVKDIETSIENETANEDFEETDTFGENSNEPLFVYKVNERKCSLVFPAKLEAAVRDGDIANVMLSKNDDTILFKMKFGNDITVDIKDVPIKEIQKVEMYDGEGISKEKKNKLGDITKKFENNEESKEKQKDDTAVEEVVEKWNNVNINDQNDSYFDTKVSNAPKTGKCDKLVTLDFEKFQHGLLKDVNYKLIVSEMPEPMNALNPTKLNLSQSIPGIIQQPGYKESITHISIKPVLKPFKPLHVSISNELIDVIHELSSKELELTNIEGVFNETNMHMLPKACDLLDIVKNIKNGKLVKIGNKEFLSVQTANGEKLVIGQNVSVNGELMFIPGQTILDENGDYFLSGIIINDNEEVKILPGHITQVDDQDMFALGMITNTRNGVEFVQGQFITMNNENKFFTGQTVVTNDGIMFVPGQIDLINGTEKFIPGEIILTPSGLEFVEGQIFEKNGECKFVAGKAILNNDGIYEFIPGKTIKVNDHLKFIPGEVIETDVSKEFVPGRYVMTENMNEVTFMPGICNEQNEFVPGIDTSDLETFSDFENDYNNVMDNLSDVEDTSSIHELFGHMVQTDASIEFYPGENTSGLPNGKLIPGKMLRSKKDIQFVPGTIINGKFIPGQMIDTDDGEKFIPGQIINTKSGPKFVPGQIIDTTEGSKFIPGQIIEVEENGEIIPKFVPGQILDTRNGPVFIPGQIIETVEHNNLVNKFIPGQVVETIEGPKFVPGRVIEVGEKITFVPGQIVETTEGLKFVAPDLADDNISGTLEYTIQGFEINSDLLDHNYDHITNIKIDNNVLKQLNKAGMSFGYEIQADVPLVDIDSTNPCIDIAHQIVKKLKLENTDAIKLSQILITISNIVKCDIKLINNNSSEMNIISDLVNELKCMNGVIKADGDNDEKLYKNIYELVENKLLDGKKTIINTVRQVSENDVKALLSKPESAELKDLILQAIGLARALGIRETASTLLSVINQPHKLHVLNRDEVTLDILKRLVVMKKLATNKNIINSLNQLQLNPDLCKNDSTLCELVRESASLMVVPEEITMYRSSNDIPASILFSDNTLASENFLSKTNMKNRNILVIVKHGCQAIFPKEASRLVLVRSSVLHSLGREGGVLFQAHACV
ncbi:hypothetical protein WDU94_000499 [Cyamophila willieti]